ncbi:hypothetical protein GN956_G23797 [Arapaima gigas]
MKVFLEKRGDMSMCLKHKQQGPRMTQSRVRVKADPRLLQASLWPQGRVKMSDLSQDACVFPEDLLLFEWSIFYQDFKGLQWEGLAYDSTGVQSDSVSPHYFDFTTERANKMRINLWLAGFTGKPPFLVGWPGNAQTLKIMDFRVTPR